MERCPRCGASLWPRVFRRRLNDELQIADTQWSCRACGWSSPADLDAPGSPTRPMEGPDRPSTDSPIRVAIISRNHVVRAGLVSLIAQLETRAVVTEASNVDHQLEPHDVAIYDLGAVTDIDAYEELRHLLERGIQVIGLVYDTQRETLAPIIDATSHVITLSATPEQLLEVLQESTPARHGQRPTDSAANRLPAGLTDQEFRVVELIGAGLSNEEITKQLYLSINSVKTHIRTAYKKIGVTDRSGAVLWALEHGLAGGPDRR